MVTNQLLIAPIQRRIAAYIVDLSIFLIFFSIFYFLLFFQHQTFEGQYGSGEFYGVSASTSIYFILFISWLLFITLTEFKNGQSIGKRLLKIIVVKQELTKTTFFDTFVRHLFDMVDLLLLVGLIIALTNSKTQRIGDLIARTVVIIKN